MKDLRNLKDLTIHDAQPKTNGVMISSNLASCEDRIGTGPPRARTQVIYVDLGPARRPQSLRRPSRISGPSEEGTTYKTSRTFTTRSGHNLAVTVLIIPRTFTSKSRPASEFDSVNDFQDSCLKVKARIWH